MRYIWMTLGLISLGLGIIGIALPLLPTVPFVLLAAFCFSRSSERLHHWLIENPYFGESIKHWHRYGAISLRAKRSATVMIAAVYLLSITLGLRLPLLIIQGVTLACVLLFLWTRPSGPR